MRDHEPLLASWATWREAQGLCAEREWPGHSIWWRFQLAEIRRLKELGIGGES